MSDAAPAAQLDSGPPRRRDTILAAIEAFREEELPRSLSSLMLFLYICENEGLTVSELAYVSKVPVAKAARIVKILAGESREAPLAADRVLFECRASPQDRRLKFVHLAPRGRQICARMEALIALATPIKAPEGASPPSAAPSGAPGTPALAASLA
jgi:DNA-binding MarR family transcriptional regulator